MERRFAAAAVLGIVVVIAFAVGVRVRSGQTYSYLYDFAVAALAFGSVGTVILVRRPGHAVGRLFIAMSLAWAVGILTGSLAVAAGSGILGVISMILRLSAFAGVALAILLFPTGEPPSPRWHPVGWTLMLGAAVAGAGVAIQSGPIEDFPALTNPIGFTSAGNQLQEIGFVLVLGGVVASVASAVARYRTARAEERQQVKFFALAALLSVVSIVAANVAFPYEVENTIVGNIVWSLPVVLLPAAVAAAILRYRLYDVDIVVNRALVYGALTATLLLSYLAIVVTLSRILDPVTQDSDIAVAASTLVVAALFRPLRERIQGFIDRRFYRARYDAKRALDSFAARLRNEVEIDAVRDDVLTVVGNTLQPRHASLWLGRGQKIGATE